MSENGSAEYRILFRELRSRGYAEGENLVVERRSGEGRTDRYPELAREVASLAPDLIYSNSRRLVQYIRAATSTIPIVAMTSDPVVAGLADSFARPGGNVTGVSTDAGLENLEKRLELLREISPAVSRLAFLAPLGSWEGPYGAHLRVAGQRLGIEIIEAGLRDPIADDEYRRAFETLSRNRAEGLMVGQQQENVTFRRLIVALAEAYRIPAVYAYREFAEIGGLLAYSVGRDELWRGAAAYIARVLDGAHPGHLPIQRPTKFELVINMNAARGLGLAVPTSLLARADEVIE
jgi:putative ABC transport system substrate-binding protein